MQLIAETAWHHDGDLEFFKKLVETISVKTNADYIKFHLSLDIDEYMHTDHPGYSWAKERVFSETQWNEIFKIVTDNGKKLMLLFNDKKAIDFGMKYKPELIEIHSVCLNDIKLLNHLKSKLNKETHIILGVGGTDLYEVEQAVEIIDSKNIVLMHGFQNYPTKYEDINFSKIRKIMELYPEFKHGYADHTAWDNDNNVLITLLGAALGMNFIEKHVTNTTGEGRTDWQAAIGMEMFIEIQKKLKILSLANGNGQLKMNKGEKAYSTFGSMKKAAILKKDMKKGDALSVDDFDFKRTGQSSDLSQLDILNSIGKIITQDLNKGHCINKFDLQ
ncbi:MAG: N-acetylneuraminate synthase family protein [Candidatus Atribacteria bacterium]|nr:N-acetylneuraminate synthase family protein [Candidatus Atribacteria bacterium]